MDAKLGKDPFGVMSYRVRADGQPPGNVTIGETTGEKERDRRFPWCEAVASDEVFRSRELRTRSLDTHEYGLVKAEDAATEKSARKHVVGSLRPELTVTLWPRVPLAARVTEAGERGGERLYMLPHGVVFRVAVE